MALDPVPWLIGGGAEHSPEVVRQALFDSTGGAEGISSVGALKVQAQSTPGGSVRVAPGGAILNNRYAGGAGQSYSARNASQSSVSITATGSAGGRTDAILLRVLDPQYEGQPPVDPNDFDYTRLVAVQAPAGITDIAQLGLTYPAILLTRVTIPANTGTITNAMITDLREVANPQSKTVIRSRATVTSGEEVLAAIREGGEWFPNQGGEQLIFIPPWATRAIISADWIMVQEGIGNAYGDCWVEFGPGVGGSGNTQDRQIATQRFRWNSANTADTKSNTWRASDDVYIPAALRGTTQAFIMKAKLSSSYPAATRPKITNMSGVELRVTFQQVADPSSS